MELDLKASFPDVPQYQLNLYAALLETLKSGNPRRVYLHDRRLGKSWMMKWLKENESLLKKLRERNSAQHQRITKVGTNTSVQKSKLSTSAGKSYDFVIFDELVTENEKTQLLNAKN